MSNVLNYFPSNDWKNVLSNELSNKEFFDSIDSLYRQPVVPAMSDVFNAFALTPYSEVKVVIIGQDPYPTPGDAMGLSFSVPPTTPLPKSLINIFKEADTDIGGCRTNVKGDLTNWATQGVLLLNTILTTNANTRRAHKDVGWQENLTIPAIKALSKRENIVFILWGNDAIEYEQYITNPNHLILKSPHPSPLGAWRGFWNTKPFSNANNYLRANSIPPINW